MLNSLN
jgi:hypothetical protein